MEITSTGRRKTAAASVRMVAGSGKITVNGVAFEKYFETEALRGYIMQPLKVCNSETAFDISANIKGGGKAGQAGALRHGIARALLLADEPSGNLDSKNREEIHSLFFRLRDELGQTTLIVTHDEGLASMADRKITMRDGEII